MSQEPKIDWRSKPTLEALRARAQLVQTIRSFFESRSVLEVETPLIGATNAPDPNLSPIPVSVQNRQRFLQTSPEFFMKRLLSQHRVCMYQICKVFRDDECGRRHNPEFTMLEWYRVGWTWWDLIAEVDALISTVLGTDKAQHLRYADLFKDFKLCPHQDSFDKIQAIARAHRAPDGLSRQDCLDYLLTLAMEDLPKQSLWVITHFPKDQAALAKLDQQDGVVSAKRFEFYYQGCELANGYDELTCAQEQAARFKAENQTRAQKKLPLLPMDTKLLQALNSGLPDCAGVAMGLDRLLMLKLDKSHIEDVVSFNFDAL